MKLMGSYSKTESLLLLGVVVFLSRLPFIFFGFGSEEDAWGLIVTARNIVTTGQYEVSRLPGHPLQEIFLTFTFDFSPWLLNLFTSFVSVIGILLFVSILRHFNIKNSLWAGIALAFTPVFFIHSTNIMDYNWALTFIMGAVFLAIKQRVVLAGLLIGLAVGFRITSGAMILPIAVLLYQLTEPELRFKGTLKFIGSSLIFSLVSFLPPLITYGVSFFTFYEYFPYPSILKNVFKGTIGVWGFPGFIGVIYVSLVTLHHIIKGRPSLIKNQRSFLIFCWITILLFMISFVRIPQKSAFIIPLLPWLYVIFFSYVTSRATKFLVFSMLISSFMFGINLNHPIRGNLPSSFSVNVNMGDIHMSLDPLIGPVAADIFKRVNKSEYAKNVSNKIQNSNHKIFLIAGWYQNEIVYFLGKDRSEKWRVVYYEDESVLSEFQLKNYRIQHLPEQDKFNDLRYKSEFTGKYSKLFVL